MAELSYFWDGDGSTPTGDDSEAPYNDDIWSDVQKLYLTSDNRSDGIINTSNAGYTGDFALTIGSGYVSLSNGAAIVDGKLYLNSSAASVVIPTPASATRYDRIVLRKNWATQTVRITRIAGVEGAGAPVAITQTNGDKWDIKLYILTVTTLGIIALSSDERVYARSPLIEQNPQLVGGRLTVDYNYPLSSSDLVGTTGIVYYVPYTSNLISLYDSANSIFRVVDFETELLGGSIYGLQVTGLTTVSKMYDIFAYLDTYNKPKLEASTTTRTTQLNKLGGMYCKTGDITRRYLGSVYVDSSGYIYDSMRYRNVWNLYNKVNKEIYYGLSSTHSYNPTVGAGTVWRNWYGGAGVTVNISAVCGDFQLIYLSMNGNVGNVTSAGAYISIDFDGGTTPEYKIGCFGVYANAQYIWGGAGGCIMLDPGRHTASVLEGVTVNYTCNFETVFVNGIIDC